MPPLPASTASLASWPTSMELLAAGIPLTLLIDLAFGVTSETLDQVSASPELAGTRTLATYLNPQANAELVEAAMSRFLARHVPDHGVGRVTTRPPVLV
jgi:hypothetical protein